MLIAFLISYGLAMALFFFMRWDYSRSQFLVSFSFVCLWFGAVGFIEPRLRRPRFVVVRFGAGRSVLNNDSADWMVASAPTEIPPGVTGIIADLRADLPSEWRRSSFVWG